MHRIVMPLLFLLFASPFAGASGTVEGHPKCQQCGMDRSAFARSRMLIVYDDGTSAGVCSLRCTALEMQQRRKRRISALKVADYTTGELTDAKSAAWVVGGAKRGVMTATAKWAFARTEDARDFVKNHGGVIATFDQAMQAATEEVLRAAEEERAVEREMLRERQ